MNKSQINRAPIAFAASARLALEVLALSGAGAASVEGLKLSVLRAAILDQRPDATVCVCE